LVGLNHFTVPLAMRKLQCRWVKIPPKRNDANAAAVSPETLFSRADR